MQHICFTMRVAIEHLARYERMHARVWPELLIRLADAGWANYSLFLRDDGLLVGYLETRDWQAAQDAVSRTGVSLRWSGEMDKLVEPGSTMRYPALAMYDDSPGGRERYCFVIDRAISFARVRTIGLHNVSVFEDAGGQTVVYGETDDPRISLPLDLGEPLREVFNLAHSLASE